MPTFKSNSPGHLSLFSLAGPEQWSSIDTALSVTMNSVLDVHFWIYEDKLTRQHTKKNYIMMWKRQQCRGRKREKWFLHVRIKEKISRESMNIFREVKVSYITWHWWIHLIIYIYKIHGHRRLTVKTNINFRLWVKILNQNWTKT